MHYAFPIYSQTIGTFKGKDGEFQGKNNRIFFANVKFLIIINYLITLQFLN